ncbi:MAG: PAS domain S-box protein [Gammaproteobacteria bacterium]
MRLRQLTWINMTLPLLLGVLMASLLFWSFYQEQERLGQIRSAQAIMLESFNLMLLGNDLTQHPELERVHQQWQTAYTNLAQLLSGLDPEAEQVSLGSMRREFQNLDTVYKRVQRFNTSNSVSLLREQLHDAQSQIGINSQKLALEAGRLMEKIRRQQVEFTERLNVVIIGSILILSLLLLWVSIRNGRRVLWHLQRLTEATQQIGSGNLDFRIRDTLADEFGDFAHAFDAMTANLKQATASRDDLQREIASNEQAQARLKAYKDQLETLVAMRTKALEQSNNQLSQTQFAMDRCGIAIHWVDAQDARLLYVNDFACELLGYQRDEMLNMTIPDIDPNFTQDDFVEQTQQLREQGRSTFKTEQRHKDGQMIPVKVTLHYQTNSGSDSAYFIAFVTDIRQSEAIVPTRKAREQSESGGESP